MELFTHKQKKEKMNAKQSFNWKEWIKENRVYVIVLAVSALFWVLISIFMGYAPFGNNSFLTNDAIHQYYPFMGQYRERLLEGQSLQYSFGGGMGFNFLSLWSYYLSSPLNLIILLFPADGLDFAMNFLIGLRLVLCSLSFAFYIGSRGNKHDLRILPFACAYGMSSFMIGYSFNIMWLDSLALFPLILTGLEKLLKNGKWKLYAVSLSLSLWSSFYITYMICIFLVIWFFFYEFENIKCFFKRGFLFAGSSVLAAGMACLVLIPAYIGVSQTSVNEQLPQIELMTTFSNILAGKEGGIFAFSDPVSVVNNASYNANLYTGIAMLGLALLYFFKRGIKISSKLKMAGLILLLFLSTNEKCLNFIWHGFHNQVGIPNRFVFLLIFVVLLLAYEAFCNLKKYPLWQILLADICVIAGLSALYVLQHISIKMFWFSVALAAGYMIMQIWYVIKAEDRKFVMGIMISVICLELLASAVTGSKLQGGITVTDFYRSQNDVYEARKLLGKDLYRQELSNPTVENEGMAYNLYGTGLFGSMVNSTMATFLGNIGFSFSSNHFGYASGTPVINTLFGLKNILVLNGDASRLDNRYELSTQTGNVDVYENKQILPIAYMCEPEVRDWKSLNADYFYNQSQLLHLMTGKQYQVFMEQEFQLKEQNDVEVQIIDNQQFGYLSAEGSRKDHIVFEAVVKEDEDLYLRLAAAYTSGVQIFINDELIADKQLSNHFYHVGDVKKGDKITLKIGIQEESVTFGKISLSMYAYHQKEMDRAFEDLNSESLLIEEGRDGYVRGKVHAEKDGVLFTTIPYEKGWRAFIDGEEAEITPINQSLIALDLETGEHEVIFKYTSPGLYAGLGISLLSLTVMVLLCICSRRRDAKENSGGQITEMEKGNED
ncbi:MAG: YfhO family protein [Clostridiales bacterium]|nr:YfhO family protein [Clostridiales bacterium]